MKKILLLSSILIMAIWIAGYFIFRLSFGIHILLVLSVFLYIRSLLYTEETTTQKYFRVKSRRSN
jgi:hypothetical protein